MKKTITILGEDITIAYNIAVELSFEEISGKQVMKTEIVDGKSVIVPGIVSKRDQVSMWLAAIIANNPDSPLVAGDAAKTLPERLTRECTFDEVKAIETAITECMFDWYKIPEITARLQQKETDAMDASRSEESEKN